MSKRVKDHIMDKNQASGRKGAVSQRGKKKGQNGKARANKSKDIPPEFVQQCSNPPQLTRMAEEEKDDFLEKQEMYAKELEEEKRKCPKITFKVFDVNDLDEPHKRFHEKRKTHCPLANYKGEKDLNERYDRALHALQAKCPDLCKENTPKSKIELGSHESLATTRIPRSVKTAQYDRRNHSPVTGNVDLYRCQYRQKYVCSERVKALNTPYCTKHQSLNEEAVQINEVSANTVINSNKCAFTVKKPFKKELVCTDLITSSNSKYCETHVNEIEEMKEKILIGKRGKRDHANIVFDHLQAAAKGQPVETESSYVVKPEMQMGQQNITETELDQLCGYDSEEEDHYTTDLTPHEMLSTAGYFTAEEITRLLSDKLLKLNSSYKVYQKNVNVLFLHRRRIFFKEIRKERKFARKYCSNPKMLPINKDFSREFIQNEIMARSEVRVLLRQKTRADRRAKLAIHKYKQVFHPSKQSGHISTNPNQSKLVGSGVTMSTGGKQCSGDKLKSDPNAPHNMESKGRSISTDEQVDEGLDATGAITPPLLCCAPDCENLQMPFTTYCSNHITQDVTQKMYVKCGVLKYVSRNCDEPVTWEEEGCRLHSGELPPDLPIDEEEKERIIEAESKQMVSVYEEEKAMETLVFCQLADVDHLNLEMDIALQPGYLSTDSETEKDSTDDETKLPPLGKNPNLNDPEDDTGFG